MILQDKLGRKSCSNLVLSAATPQEAITYMHNAESKTQHALFLRLDQQPPMMNKSFFDSSRCRRGVQSNLFLTPSQRYSIKFRPGFFYCHGLHD